MTLVPGISNNHHVKSGNIIDQSICFLPVDFLDVPRTAHIKLESGVQARSLSDLKTS